MARPNIPAAVLADRGVPLTLLGGLQVVLCYTFRSLMMLEERYGSLQEAMSILGATTDATKAETDAETDADPAAPVPSAIDRPMFTGLVGILSCGLTHEVAPSQSGVPGDGNPLSEPEVLADYLDLRNIGSYAAVIGEAFSKSFPAAPAGETPDPPLAPPSLGGSGTTLPSSTSDSPPPSSGA